VLVPMMWWGLVSFSFVLVLPIGDSVGDEGKPQRENMQDMHNTVRLISVSLTCSVVNNEG